MLPFPTCSTPMDWDGDKDTIEVRTGGRSSELLEISVKRRRVQRTSFVDVLGHAKYGLDATALLIWTKTLGVVEFSG